MSTQRLFHVSEESDIQLFLPRPVPSPDAGVTGSAVWAVDEAHLPNYLLPRDCPRITFSVGPVTSELDRVRFNVSSQFSRVVAVEEAWLSRIEECSLYLYEFSQTNFEIADQNAGYFISRQSERPVSAMKLSNLPSELARRGTELRVLVNLWDLRESISRSTLSFSVIRFRNAQPRPTPPAR